MDLIAVILAAGLGKRMKSKLPKVMHKLCGRPIIRYAVKVAREAGAAKVVVVVGHGREAVEAELGSEVEYVYQEEQLGTAHAVMQAREVIEDYMRLRGEGKGRDASAGISAGVSASEDPGEASGMGACDVLVMAGDMPLLETPDIVRLVEEHRRNGADVTILSAIFDEPIDFGRVVRDNQGNVTKVVEERDASPEEAAIREMNTSIYCFRASSLFESLKCIDASNAQKEYYLTDAIGILAGMGRKVHAVVARDSSTVKGINSRRQLAEAEAILRERIRQRHMDEGVTMIDPGTTFIDEGVTIGRDTIIYPLSFIEGATSIGEDCVIGPNVRLRDVKVGSGAKIENAVIYQSSIGPGASVGPFAYIRPETVVEEGARVGTFVEIKKSYIGKGSKVPHQSYVGDATLGEGVNIGAGTITCNYDGRRKHKTLIGDNVFIGSNTNLVAPVNIHKGAYVAAGSTITMDVPEGALGIARGHQRNIENWVARRRQTEEQKQEEQKQGKQKEEQKEE
ncbi:MAG: bifunctional UDP-N-acetylglucosamine diphosphorylase/glucosamine-1-phosphate N-acetyltransferase GlmU [Firmicutes bacterium]|nr:bifunctional UDP-N-acetylglucosamine diphosphorylase/glucosamine-1-phosphate N-acetyltransferase GlmU [Bacillota bacterium]